MKTNKKSYQILGSHLKKLQKENSNFSIRSLGMKIGVSHTFLTNILNGKQFLPLKRLDQICAALKIDEFDKIEIKNCLLVEKSGLTETFQGFQPNSMTSEELLPEGHFRVLRNWWNLAILEFLSCHPTSGRSKAEILSRIPVQENELDISLNELIQIGLVSKTDDLFFKTHEHLRIPTRSPNPITRNFYKSTLTLAQRELDKKDIEHFEKRFITHISCAVNTKNIPKAKKRLAEALAEVRDILTEGECTEVYFLQTQLFNVLK